MKLATTVPRVAFVVDLNTADPDQAKAARMHHLVHLFSGHRLPATWTVDSPERVESLRKQVSPTAAIEVALKIDQQWLSPLASHSQFRSALDARISALTAAGEASISLVVGDPQLLRPRAAILAEQGIAGVFAPRQNCAAPAKLRPLPCGLWQLEPSFCIPPKRTFINFWAGHRRRRDHDRDGAICRAWPSRRTRASGPRKALARDFLGSESRSADRFDSRRNACRAGRPTGSQAPTVDSAVGCLAMARK